MTCSQTVCTGSHIDQNQFQIGEDLKRKAKTYLTQFYKDHKRYEILAFNNSKTLKNLYH